MNTRRDFTRHSAAILHIIQSFLCNLGLLTEFGKAGGCDSSNIQYPKSRNKTIIISKKNKKKIKVLPSLSPQKTWLIQLLNVPLRFGPEPRILSLCAFFCTCLCTGLGSDCNVSLQQLFFGFHHNTKINKTNLVWFSICYFGSMTVLFFFSSSFFLDTRSINTIVLRASVPWSQNNTELLYEGEL